MIETSPSFPPPQSPCLLAPPLPKKKKKMDAIPRATFPLRLKWNSRRNDTSVFDFDEVPAKETQHARFISAKAARFFERIPPCTSLYPLVTDKR